MGSSQPRLAWASAGRRAWKRPSRRRKTATFSTPSFARSLAPSSGASFVRTVHWTSSASSVTAWPSRFAFTFFLPPAPATHCDPTKKQCSLPSGPTSSVGSIARPIVFHGSVSASSKNGTGGPQLAGLPGSDSRRATNRPDRGPPRALSGYAWNACDRSRNGSQWVQHREPGAPPLGPWARAFTRAPRARMTRCLCQQRASPPFDGRIGRAIARRRHGLGRRERAPICGRHHLHGVARRVAPHFLRLSLVEGIV